MSEVEMEYMSKIKFYVSINGINEFASKVVIVPGNIWSITFAKASNEVTNTNEIDNDFLAINLNWENDDERPVNWACVASLSVKLMRSTQVQFAHRFQGEPFVFDANNKVCSSKRFIKWNDLLNVKYGYVRNDSCKFEVEIDAGPIQMITDEWLKFDVIEKCCDKSLTRKFRLTMNNLHESNLVCSPEIHINNSSWRVVVTKDKWLKAILLKVDKATNALDFPIDCITSLKSFDENIDSVTMVTKTTNINARIEAYMLFELFSMPWTNVIDPLQKFVKNGSFHLEIEMKMNAKEEIPISGLDLTCPICSQSLFIRSVSATICGHIFHSDCVRFHLFNVNQRCPECQRSLSLVSLCIIYLPTKLVRPSKFVFGPPDPRNVFDTTLSDSFGKGQRCFGNTQTSGPSFGSLQPEKTFGFAASSNFRPTEGSALFGASTTMEPSFSGNSSHETLFGTLPCAVSTTTASTFGTLSPGKTFGSATSSNFGQTQGSALFGASKSLFGAPSVSSAPTSLATTTTSTGLFGNLKFGVDSKFGVE